MNAARVTEMLIALGWEPDPGKVQRLTQVMLRDQPRPGEDWRKGKNSGLLPPRKPKSTPQT